ncbi:ParB N-terminal domain-containing protein [Streptomyces sp. NPDC087440]|uniref:ParB/RepB/Spo0J family partition protein n=1 Tax=Streptomyces sp. NPDC087440 TaxID=3365790 RepID=UPI00382F8644
MFDVFAAGGPPTPQPADGGQPAVELVPIASLTAADSPRATGEDADHVETLAETCNVLPPIVVHRPTMRVVDGVHRLRAAVLRGEESIEVRFVEGSAEDAFVLAVRLNAEHGLPLSRKDRLFAAERIIAGHVHWSDRRIAEVTGLAPTTIASLRERSTVQVEQLNARTGRDGRSRPVNGAAGRLRAGQIVAERPEASLREIAREAGIALATARDVRLRVREGRDPVPPKLREAAPASHPAETVQEKAERPNRAVPAAAVTPPVVRSRPEPVLVSDAGRLANLARDPSLRFSEGGRALLQLLAPNALDDEKWKWLMGAVPEHRYADIARAARHCGERWISFAEGLEHGNSAPTGRAV